MTQTFAHFHFNGSYIRNHIESLKGSISDKDFIQVWQSWVHVREAHYGIYEDEKKKQDFENLIKISNGDREKAFDFLNYLIHAGYKKHNRITAKVAREYEREKPFEWE